MDNLFQIVFVSILIFFLYRTFKYKSLKGAMFGAEILHTVGEVQGKGQSFLSLALKVHTLKSDRVSHGLVGIEIVAKSFASYQMMPVTLQTTEAQKLITLLESAINE